MFSNLKQIYLLRSLMSDDITNMAVHMRKIVGKLYFSNFLIGSFWFGWLSGGLIEGLDWFVAWLMDCLIDGLIDWLSNLLVDWLID